MLRFAYLPFHVCVQRSSKNRERFLTPGNLRVEPVESGRAIGGVDVLAAAAVAVASVDWLGRAAIKRMLAVS